MKNIPHHPGKIPIPQMQSNLPIGGNFPLRNPLHKFIHPVIQTVHIVCKLQFEQLSCPLLNEFLQGFQSCSREIVAAVPGKFE